MVIQCIVRSMDCSGASEPRARPRRRVLMSIETIVCHLGASRAADDGRPRYKLPDGFAVSRVVYGLNEALDQSSDSLPLIVVEGPFKVWHLVQCGFPNTVSTFTSSISDEQAGILAATRRSIVLLFDGDEAGRAGMRKGAAKLISETYVRVVKLPSDVDPDHLSQEQLDELLGFAKP